MHVSQTFKQTVLDSHHNIIENRICLASLVLSALNLASKIAANYAYRLNY